MFREICVNEPDWDESLQGVPYVARTMGCGCCCEWVPLTVENLQEHIADLRKRLKYAEDLSEVVCH